MITENLSKKSSLKPIINNQLRPIVEAKSIQLSSEDKLLKRREEKFEAKLKRSKFFTLQRHLISDSFMTEILSRIFINILTVNCMNNTTFNIIQKCRYQLFMKLN